ncbi:hypothetical protein D3C87_943070 [compost metagenome]
MQRLQHAGVVEAAHLSSHRRQVDGAAHQLGQRVRLHGARLFQLGRQREGLAEQGFHLRQVQLGNRAYLKAAGKDAQRFGAAVDRGARQFHPFVEFTQAQVAIGHLRHQSHADGAARLVAGQQGLQRAVFQAAHPAPEIEFPGAHVQARLVLRAGHGAARRTQIIWHACAAAGGAQRDGGKLLRALDAIRGARLFHAQRGDADVAVAGQRLRNERLQARVGKVALPGDVGCVRAGRIGFRILRRHGQRRWRIRRRHRGAAGQGQRGCQGGQHGAVWQGKNSHGHHLPVNSECCSRHRRTGCRP